MFVIAGIISGSGIPTIAVDIIVYTFFSLLLIGVNYLSLRFIGSDISAGFMIFIYFIAVLIFMLPGLVISIATFFISFNYHLSLLILAAWEFVSAFVCFILARSIIADCDMPTMPISGK
jgi:hypothetical protein